MKTPVYQADRNVILDRVFAYLAQNGLENITIRELCKGTGYVQGSLYYWFGDKTTIICECTEFGLKKVTDKIFRYVFEHIDDLKGLFAGCLDEVGKHKNELRFIYQMAASPVYGDRIRKKGQNFNCIYDDYTHQLSLKFGCNEDRLRPLVYLFISAVLDYVIWDEKEKTQNQLDFIYSILPDVIKNK